GRDDEGAGPDHRVGPDREDVRLARRLAHARLRDRAIRLRLRLRLAGALLTALVAASVLVPASSAHAASAITGGGSSVAALELDQWRADTARKPYNLQVNYVSQGSTFGRTEFIQNHLDYGASDITFQPQEIGPLQSGRCGGRAPDTGCFVYVPVSAGGLSFMY